MKSDISFVLNGLEVQVSVKGSDLLLYVLRRSLGQTGTKEGCGKGECGACTVLVDGRAVNACLFPAMEVDGAEVTTIEGLGGTEGGLSTIQQAFVDRGGIQCGFCTPGMVVSAKALLDANPLASEDDIRDALTGNLCRCTGYVQIVDSVKHAGAALRSAGREGGEV